MAPKPPRRPVPSAVIRERFNSDRLHVRARREDIRVELRRFGHPHPETAARIGVGALSEYWDYYDASGTRVAGAHLYVFPDGRLLNDRPDPKGLLVDGFWWYPDDPAGGT